MYRERTVGDAPPKFATPMDGAVARVRAKLASGALPRGAPHKISTGLGKGLACSGCERPITAAELEDQVEMPGGGMLRLHRNCLGVWQASLARAPRKIAGGSTVSPWTALFDLQLGRQAAHDRASYDELRATVRESLLAASEARRASIRSRVRSRLDSQQI
jgi:hypothetical protein